MLSRVADALYWMSRYVERAEQSARLLSVTRDTLVEIREVDPGAASQHRATVREVLGVPDVPDWDLVFSETTLGSIMSSVARARENARQVREVISSEMWENLNEAYWKLKDLAVAEDREAVQAEILGDVVDASFLWGGITDGTMGRGDGWLFIKLGQFIERAMRTSRTISAKFGEIDDAAAHSGASYRDNLLRITLLRSCCALEAYRKVHATRLGAQHVVDFLVCDRAFPRTVRYSIAVAAEFAQRLGPDGGRNSPQRAFGRLSAKLEYTDVEDILAQGVRPFLDGVVQELGDASLGLQRTYFLH